MTHTVQPHLGATTKAVQPPVTPAAAPLGAAQAPAAPAWTVDLPLQAPPARAPKPRILDLRAEHRAADKNKDGKLTRRESRLSSKDFKAVDRNRDGKLTYMEQRAHVDRTTSFQGLDANRDGRLSAEEMAKLTRRFDARNYDANQDGAVDRAEFTSGRRAELAANRQARREREWKSLAKGEKKRLKRYDTNKDGVISLQEYHRGRGADWRKGRQRRIDAVFKAVSGGQKVLDAKKAKGYRAYDANEDGKVTKGEFSHGAVADLNRAFEHRLSGGAISDKALRKRLFLGASGQRLELPSVGPTAGELHANREKWFICQYPGASNPGEDAAGNGNCGPTSLTMAAWAFGAINPKSRQELDAHIEKSRAMMGFGPNEYAGTSSEGIAAGARKYGLDATVHGGVNLQKIQAELARGRVVVVNTSTYHLSGRRGGGHFSVVTAIKDGKVYLNDSARQAPMVVDAGTYMESIRDKGFYHMVSIGKRG